MNLSSLNVHKSFRFASKFAYRAYDNHLRHDSFIMLSGKKQHSSRMAGRRKRVGRRRAMIPFRKIAHIFKDLRVYSVVKVRLIQFDVKRTELFKKRNIYVYFTYIYIFLHIYTYMLN